MKNKTKTKLIFLAISFFGIFGMAKSSLAACEGASPTWTTTPDYESVAACIANATRGDTISVAAGDGAETWNQQLVINKGINLIGPGRDNLTITMGFNATDNTNCKFGMGYINTLIVYKPTTPSLVESIKIAGFTFDADFRGGALEYYNGDIGKIDTLILANNRFKNTQINRTITTCSTFFGVMYENIFDSTGISISVNAEDETAWANTIFTPGSAESLYYEDNTFINGIETFHDNGVGAKFCARFNNYTTDGVGGMSPWYDAHGNQNTGNSATMGVEIYENTVSGVPSNASVKLYDARGGQSMVFHNNVITGGFVGMEIWEEYNDMINPLTVGGHGEKHNGADGSAILVDTTQNWIPNRYVGYYLMNVSAATSYSENPVDWSEGLITANTATTITATLSGGTRNTWNASDYYFVYKKRPYIQKVNNSYFWENMKNGSTIVPAEITMNFFSRYNPTKTSEPLALQENREFWTQRSGTFDGTGSSDAGGGVGEGTLANRPITCTAGVGYWATDAGGDWNKKNATANDGALYRCTDRNTWVLYYTPYTYPHPLRTVIDTIPPSAPSGLSVS